MKGDFPSLILSNLSGEKLKEKTNYMYKHIAKNTLFNKT